MYDEELEEEMSWQEYLETDENAQYDLMRDEAYLDKLYYESKENQL